MAINISTSSAFFAWKPSAWLRVTGPDAGSFLQGQFTQDLRMLERQRAVYGLWLSVKGRVLADSFVLRGAGGDEFWLGSYFSPAGVIRERLESHVIADDVVVEDFTSVWAGISLIGPGVAGVSTGGEGFVFSGRRVRGECLEWVFPHEAAGRLGERLGGWRELDAEEIARLRIAAGIPAVPADAGPGDLPAEAGLDADAISYSKGCYLGQEVVARLRAMGQVRRRLVPVAAATPELPDLPAPLFAAGRRAGELRSAVRDGRGGAMGLAMVSTLQAAPGAALALAADAEPAWRWVVGAGGGAAGPPPG